MTFTFEYTIRDRRKEVVKSGHLEVEAVDIEQATARARTKVRRHMRGGQQFMLACVNDKAYARQACG